MSRIRRAHRALVQFAMPGWGDRGGVAVLVSILLASGVLLGIAALSVDVGQLNAEREELMSAADGAAQQVATTCGRTPAACANSTVLADVMSQAADVANANGKDGRNDITSYCGVGGALPPCDPTTEPNNLTACLGTAPTNGVKYVEIHTATATQTSTLLPTAFAASFVPGYHGARVGACSRVAWGTPSRGLSVTFAACEWDKATDHGHTYYPFPPNPPAEAEVVLATHGQGADQCTDTTPSGQDDPGGFGWLVPDADTNCQTSIQPGDTYPQKTGALKCVDAVIAAAQSHEPVFIPIYAYTTGKGSNTLYHAAGMATFVITGYYFPGNGNSAPSWLTGRTYCSGNDFCIYGFFTSALLPADTPIQAGDNPYAGTEIQTIG